MSHYNSTTFSRTVNSPQRDNGFVSPLKCRLHKPFIENYVTDCIPYSSMEYITHTSIRSKVISGTHRGTTQDIVHSINTCNLTSKVKSSTVFGFKSCHHITGRKNNKEFHVQNSVDMSSNNITETMTAYSKNPQQCSKSKHILTEKAKTNVLDKQRQTLKDSQRDGKTFENVIKTPKSQCMERLQKKVSQYLALLQNINKVTKNTKRLKKRRQESAQVLQSPSIKTQKDLTCMKDEVKTMDIECNSYQAYTKPNSEAYTESESTIDSPILPSTNVSSSIRSSVLPNSKSFTESFTKTILKDRITIQDFIVLQKRGQGRLGQVLQVVDKATGWICALKKIKKDIIRENNLQQQFIKEVKVQSYIDHSNLVKLYGFFDDEKHVYLIMQYLEEGSLDQKMEKRNYHKKGTKLFNDEEISTCIQCVLSGLTELHQQEIMHRDIKPANIVISHGVYKLCDFGWATPNPDQGRRTTYCGTFDYAPPEIFKGQTYDLQVDLWELGVMVFQLATGRLPFYKSSHKETLESIVNYQGNLNFPKQTSTQLRDFICNLLQKKPQDRLPASKLLQHSFIRTYSEQVKN